jgi:ribokinase
MRVAVVGHSEWVTFAQVHAIPGPGDIIHSGPFWDEPAGGGAVASVELARLAGSSTFFTALGNDSPATALVKAMTRFQVNVEAIRRPEPHPRAFTFLDPEGERTITVLGAGLKPRGEEPLPWEELARMDAVYFVSGDVTALRHARRAKVLVATARVLPVLSEARVSLDVLVHSSADAGEQYEEGSLEVPPAAVVSTEGSRGGRWRTASGEAGRYPAVPIPGERQDAYGAGDSFAAGLTFALGRGDSLSLALEQAARSGAAAFARRGALGLAPA